MKRKFLELFFVLNSIKLLFILLLFFLLLKETTLKFVIKLLARWKNKSIKEHAFITLSLSAFSSSSPSWDPRFAYALPRSLCRPLSLSLTLSSTSSSRCRSLIFRTFYANFFGSRLFLTFLSQCVPCVS